MTIEKTIITDGGAASYHVLRSVTVGGNISRITAQVDNYLSREDYEQGRGLVWQDYPDFENLPESDGTISGVFDAVQRELVTRSYGKYTGGVYTPEGSEIDLQVLKDRKWAAFKTEREQRENAGFEFPGIGIFDSDPESRSRILGAVSAALIASTKGAPFTMDWTLANNAVVTLDAETMINVGLVAMQHINSIHGESRIIFNRVSASPDVEDLNSLTWESALLPYTPPEAPEEEGAE